MMQVPVCKPFFEFLQSKCHYSKVWNDDADCISFARIETTNKAVVRRSKSSQARLLVRTVEPRVTRRTSESSRSSAFDSLRIHVHNPYLSNGCDLASPHPLSSPRSMISSQSQLSLGYDSEESAEEMYMQNGVVQVHHEMHVQGHRDHMHMQYNSFPHMHQPQSPHSQTHQFFNEPMPFHQIQQQITPPQSPLHPVQSLSGGGPVSIIQMLVNEYPMYAHQPSAEQMPVEEQQRVVPSLSMSLAMAAPQDPQDPTANWVDPRKVPESGCTSLSELMGVIVQNAEATGSAGNARRRGKPKMHQSKPPMQSRRTFGLTRF